VLLNNGINCTADMQLVSDLIVARTFFRWEQWLKLQKQTYYVTEVSTFALYVNPCWNANVALNTPFLRFICLCFALWMVLRKSLLRQAVRFNPFPHNRLSDVESDGWSKILPLAGTLEISRRFFAMDNWSLFVSWPLSVSLLNPWQWKRTQTVDLKSLSAWTWNM